MVLKQEEFQVVDAKSGEELTRQILLQIILEEESGSVPMFSSDLLSQMIRSYGGAMQGFMGSYLEKNVEAFQQMQKSLQDQSQRIYGDNSRASQELWSQFMNLQGPGDAEPDAGLHGAEPEDVRAVPGPDAEPGAQHVHRLLLPRLPAAAAARADQARHRKVVAGPNTAPRAVPKVGFVSLGCPKALVDSERILTQLRAEGYATAKDYGGADLVIVNTCGFIDAAVEESLDAIGEALAENGKVIVTGCLGAKDGVVKSAHPSVLAVTGPHDTEGVMRAVHAHLPKPHDPYTDLVPPQGISSRRSTTRTSRSPRAATTAAASASSPRCAATSCRARSAK